MALPRSVKCLASSPALGVTGDELLVSADSSGTLKFWAVGPYTAEEFGEVMMRWSFAPTLNCNCYLSLIF